MIETSYNPDVLSCLANLSNDEVFTPPNMVDEMLDLLPNQIWSDPKITFLDPVSKSGVFLREITKRLDKGLESIIPDKQERINHILKNQVFGIAITELTSLLSRRSVYCSKIANNKYSLCTDFSNEQGNIHYERMNHYWQNGKCKYCGATKDVYDRGSDLETYAYQFIHIENPEKILNMKFDVIVGNPPYQLSSNDGGIQAIPLYNKFIEQAKVLNPRYMTMIIPARWYTGGMGLADFRNNMLNDKSIRVLVDFPKSRECFPGVDIAGGVCYFLWDRDNKGSCEIVSVLGDKRNKSNRDLNEFNNVFIRDNTGVNIIHKILSNKFLSDVVYPISPFGLATNVRGALKDFNGSIKVISSSGESFIENTLVIKNKDIIPNYKVIIGQLNPDRAGVNNAKDGMMNVTTKIRILEPNEVHTATYILLDSFKLKNEAENFKSYVSTKFVRYLISLTLSSMHITRESFKFVPIQDFSESWTDEKLYKKYSLTDEEILFIEGMIRPMEFSQNSNNDEQ
jgi:site-specific DNA-methyltransferase (adenine-specific)